MTNDNNVNILGNIDNSDEKLIECDCNDIDDYVDGFVELTSRNVKKIDIIHLYWHIELV